MTVEIEEKICLNLGPKGSDDSGGAATCMPTKVSLSWLWAAKLLLYDKPWLDHNHADLYVKSFLPRRMSTGWGEVCRHRLQTQHTEQSQNIGYAAAAPTTTTMSYKDNKQLALRKVTTIVIKPFQKTTILRLMGAVNNQKQQR
ncbi:unnamed protein product [Ceratitis capitata]|uniref:(Mediterranean fruit fly) hypothetical protein n=1 Tax=Ceratitis capitata TaxID=7213 RepID=A0A811VFY5_CERCA|nr:unnamed protein product [Ceratitis capitata]